MIHVLVGAIKMAPATPLMNATKEEDPMMDLVQKDLASAVFVSWCDVMTVRGINCLIYMKYLFQFK